ncbi:hypothetical protein RIF29_29224 [Crotalaria pallida]|uniref:Endonuclease/exonuclease/phosphatase domain-containing protein n=1 Tax=Crotalaria pallida TaxID=3830 RepID=A0AAN9HTP9_CROPI
MESAHEEVNVVNNVSNKNGSLTKGTTPKRKWVKKRARNNELKIHMQKSPVQPTPLAHEILTPNGPNHANKAQSSNEVPQLKGKDLLTQPSAPPIASSLSVKSASMFTQNTSCPTSSSKPTFKSAMNIEWVAGNRFRFWDKRMNIAQVWFLHRGLRDLKILSWNVRGSVNKDVRRYSRELISKHKLDCVFLMETHCLFAAAIVFWKRLGYVACDIVEARGHSGGIWVLVKENSDFSFAPFNTFHQCITFSISKGSHRWLCSAIYANPSPILHERLWNHLTEFNTDSLSWLLLGDFNEILLPLEFTWSRKNLHLNMIHKRLGRALSNCAWRNLFAEAIAETLCRVHSDHNPILVQCGSFFAESINRPFRFQAAWTTHKDFSDIVHQAWLKGMSLGIILKSKRGWKLASMGFN